MLIRIEFITINELFNKYIIAIMEIKYFNDKFSRTLNFESKGSGNKSDLIDSKGNAKQSDFLAQKEKLIIKFQLNRCIITHTNEFQICRASNECIRVLFKFIDNLVFHDLIYNKPNA